MDATDSINATPAPLDAPRTGLELEGRPSVVGFVVGGVLWAAMMYVVMAVLVARASGPMAFVNAGMLGVGGVAFGVLLIRELRGVATGYLAAADRRDFLARLDAEARWLGHRLDPPAGSTPTVPSVARVVLAPAATRGAWWVVHVAFDGDLAVLTGPRYFVRRLTTRFR